jgi:hypothetical protein
VERVSEWKVSGGVVLCPEDSGGLDEGVVESEGLGEWPSDWKDGDCNDCLIGVDNGVVSEKVGGG